MRAVASNDISTGEPLDDISAECSSVVTPAPLPLSDTATRATAHSVSSTHRSPYYHPAGPLSAIRPAYHQPPSDSTDGITGSRHLGIRETSACQPIPAVATRGGDTTTAVIRWIIITVGLRRDRLVVAWTAPPGIPDVANRRSFVKKM